MTEQDQDPDDMNADGSVDVHCSATEISDYNDYGFDSMDDDERECVRRRVTLSQNKWHVGCDETAN